VEQSLRDRLRAGDALAFGELFDAQAQVVYRHGLRLTGDRTLAEDVVSTTFLQAWRQRGGIDADGGSLRPWLLGIATNVVRNINRSKRRDRNLLARVRWRDEVPDFADDVAAQVDGARDLTTARAALAALRSEEREVIALCVWAELDYASAARALGVPIGTVRSRLSRARRKLSRLPREPVPGTRQVASGRPIAASRPSPEAINGQ
jgi:RNA polymerase sigma-70 factor (ECF subfamily)